MYLTHQVYTPNSRGHAKFNGSIFIQRPYTAIPVWEEKKERISDSLLWALIVLVAGEWRWQCLRAYLYRVSGLIACILVVYKGAYKSTTRKCTITIASHTTLSLSLQKAKRGGRSEVSSWTCHGYRSSFVVRVSRIWLNNGGRQGITEETRWCMVILS